jgi:AcrR family transcriptional regulator
MREILEVATEEFAKKGLAGARIDEIAAATRTSKRMIYYYFESKESLYVAVLEEAYRKVRHIEGQLHLEQYEPREALRRLVIFTFEHHLNNQSYIRLVMSENMQRGAYLAQSKSIQDLNVPAISTIAQLYQRGLDLDVFRPGLTPLAIHASISALTFFNVSNAHTFGLIFKLDTLSEDVLSERKAQIVDLIDRYVCVHS